MSFDFPRLLDPSPMPLETGYRRLENGVLHVSVRTDLHNCKGNMFEWWFGSRPGTREYRWWHPKDHVSSTWEEGEKGSPIGAIHVVEERLTDLPVTALRVQFRDPAETFDAAALLAARQSAAVSGIVCANVGFGEDIKRTSEGRIIGSRMVHICRDTDWGTVLRSTFLLGFDLPNLGAQPHALSSLIPDAMGPNLVQHCYDEMTFLSRVLPSIFAAEGKQPEDVRRPW